MNLREIKTEAEYWLYMCTVTVIIARLQSAELLLPQEMFKGNSTLVRVIKSLRAALIVNGSNPHLCPITDLMFFTKSLGLLFAGCIMMAYIYST